MRTSDAARNLDWNPPAQIALPAQATSCNLQLTFRV